MLEPFDRRWVCGASNFVVSGKSKLSTLFSGFVTKEEGIRIVMNSALLRSVHRRGWVEGVKKILWFSLVFLFTTHRGGWVCACVWALVCKYMPLKFMSQTPKVLKSILTVFTSWSFLEFLQLEFSFIAPVLLLYSFFSLFQDSGLRGCPFVCHYWKYMQGL